MGQRRIGGQATTTTGAAFISCHFISIHFIPIIDSFIHFYLLLSFHLLRLPFSPTTLKSPILYILTPLNHNIWAKFIIFHLLSFDSTARHACLHVSSHFNTRTTTTCSSLHTHSPTHPRRHSIHSIISFNQFQKTKEEVEVEFELEPDGYIVRRCLG